MIFLDTNYLIKVLIAGSIEEALVREWYREVELCTSTVAWYEFLCGPVDDEGISIVRGLLCDRILPFTSDAAIESSRLFNCTGRKRNLRIDAMIAASAIISDADLATGNHADFSFFTPFGLRLRVPGPVSAETG